MIIISSSAWALEVRAGAKSRCHRTFAGTRPASAAVTERAVRCRVPIPWTRTGRGFGFSLTDGGACPAEPWLPQPPDWGRYSVESQLADERSFLSLYRMALRLRREHPALGAGTLRWLDAEGLLCFAREPGFVLAANLGAAPAPLPAHREILLASGPVTGGSLPPDTAVWLSP